MFSAAALLLLPVGGLLLVALLIALSVSKRLIKDLPHPPMWPILSNAYLFINKTPSEFLNISLKNLVETYGNRFQIALGPDLLFFTAHKKDFEEILSSQQLISKAHEYDVLRNWLGDGILLSTGRKWHSRRKALTPAFHFKILEQFVDVFDQQAQVLVDDVLSRFGPKDKVDIYPLATLMALDVICETAMGVRINAQVNSDSEYVLAVKDITHIHHIRMFDFLMRYNQFFKLTSLAKREQKALRTLHSFTDSVITRRRQELLAEANEKGEEAEEDLGIKRKMNLIDMLLRTSLNGLPLTNAEIREEVDTFMFEGHDTTTSAISFTIYMLAKHPEVQQKVYEEAVQVLGKDNSVPKTISLLNDLHYLELCIKETLRLYPSVPMFARTVDKDITINGSHLKKGTSVIASAYFIQRNPEYFPEPEKFKPERFTEEKSAERNSPFTYVPFSAGPRNCIGQKFAMTEMKSVLSKMILNYEFSGVEGYEGPELVAELILKPENGVPVHIKKRV